MDNHGAGVGGVSQNTGALVVLLYHRGNDTSLFEGLRPVLEGFVVPM